MEVESEVEREVGIGWEVMRALKSRESVRDSSRGVTACREVLRRIGLVRVRA